MKAPRAISAVLVVVGFIWLAAAQTVRLSQEPAITTVSTNDDLLINQWTGSNYVTKRVRFDKLLSSMDAHLRSFTLGYLTSGSNVIFVTNKVGTVSETLEINATGSSTNAAVTSGITDNTGTVINDNQGNTIGDNS